MTSSLSFAVFAFAVEEMNALDLVVTSATPCAFLTKVRMKGSERRYNNTFIPDEIEVMEEARQAATLSKISSIGIGELMRK